ncbi:site-2 protease family protein [Allokutzneria sp. A3M-2-11 16]|uniref:site-2 protease family protein n=1 Tax=Allokutzneria sp. A3M-2-11 16 TaxID=2962043 RepID=UPI0020B7B727|nr:site-2 protease family protein [Allokutzneria sp. A3M-2-11 16]MCP3800507.1 site-2 protease family protein [Allokutzneria sp. A3M-2-11 16]
MIRQAVRPSPLFLLILAITAVGCFLSTVDNEVVMTIGIVVTVLGGWTASLCLHEFGHALFAYRGGDRSVVFKGYLTLDPRRYTDPVLSLLLPLLFLAIGGIPLPGGAVWINRHALRNKGAESAVSLAGPLANLGIGILLALAVTITQPAPGLAAGLSYLASLQVMAFVLNILPIPGLDGYGAIEPYLPYRYQEMGAKARQWAPLILFAVLIGIPPVNEAFHSLSGGLFGLVGGDPFAALVGQYLFMFWR